MFKFKNTLKIVFALTILFFILIVSTLNSNVYSATRTEDLSSLVNYPEIYTAVQEMKTAHPNWTFTILYTGLDWDTVIYNETTALHTRSLVHNSLIVGDINDWICPTCYTTPQDNGTWLCASNKTASYYIDPRNWLNETYIFAFETLSFNSNVHTLEGVQAMLAGTFMDTSTITYIDTNGNQQVINKSYAQVIFEAAQTNGISPYHLAARIIQEQGSGNNALISGKKEGYVGYYNYFNIGASGDTESEIIINGLTRAVNEGWTTPELSINGGASFLKGGYIGNYQDTLYLQKYHVDNSSKYALYGHQYQQNVSAPYTEGLEVRDTYEELGILESNFNFIIPIYENMPTTASEKPGRKVSLQTENVMVQTLFTPLSIRSGPSTDYYMKAQAPKGTTLIRIERAEEISSDGRYWDRVAYCTGNDVIIGYASREYLVEIPTVETVNEERTIEVMCALKNGPASTVNTKVKQILNPGTKVTVIDKMQYSTFGHTWYRVRLEDGTEGYVSSAYLTTEPVVQYEIEGTYVYVTPDTTATDIPNCILNGKVFGTGAKVTMEEQEYTVIMLGDVNGDGEVDARDSARILKFSINQYELNDVQKKSADVNKDTAIDARDSARILKASINLYTITLK